LDVDQYSKAAYLTCHKVIIPLTVIGPAEKYNAMAWKTEACYGNPFPNSCHVKIDTKNFLAFSKKAFFASGGGLI
jgi:hypothetical protein